MTFGRHAPPSPLARHSALAPTTVIADVHQEATAAQAPWTTSGPPPPPRSRDHHRPEVVSPRAAPQRQRFATPEDRRCRVLRRPSEHEDRQWTSLEHGVETDARRSQNMERTTRRVRSYEDRCLLPVQVNQHEIATVGHPVPAAVMYAIEYTGTLLSLFFK